MAELKKTTGESGGYRVPPLVMSRLARGGKTTALCLLFDALKAEKVNVILISFNGNNGGDIFQEVEDETQTHAIIRNIVR